MNPYDEQLAWWSKLIMQGDHYYVKVEASFQSNILPYFVRGDSPWSSEWDVLSIRLPKDGELPGDSNEDLIVTWHGVYSGPLEAIIDDNRVLRVLNEPLR